MTPLERSWHPVAWTTMLKNKPIATEVLGCHVVAFRNADGKASVIDDRCPHKGVKLSGGQCTSKGIECPYHGWIFDDSGTCVHMPSHVGDVVPSVRKVPTYITREEQGTVWFTFSPDPYEPNPPDWHFPDKRSFRTVLDIDCEYIRLMENLVDNPHAGYIHGKLLRGRPTTKVISLVSETPRGVLASTIDEKARRSLIYRVFGKQKDSIEHTEEFIAPNVIRTVFSQPGGTHASSQFVCVPVNDRKTRMFYRITLDCPFAPLLIHLFKRMVNRVVVQDKIILEHEAQQEWSAPGFKRTSCKADIAAIWTARAAQAYVTSDVQTKETFRTIETDYRL